VKPINPQSLSSRGCAVRSHVAGWAAYRFSAAELPSLRQKPGLFLGAPLPPSSLKHSDEQTIAGLVAVSRAIDKHGLNHVDFRSWGVIAAPRYLGRATLAVALARFATEGAWGISPHLIPHRSLHSPSGTISQVLKINGPNYGVGGGADGAAEALVTASAMLADGEVPGLWLVLTGFDPELVPTNPGAEEAPLPSSDCIAVALALVAAEKQDMGLCLSVGAGDTGPQDVEGQSFFGLEDFAATISSGATLSRWRLRTGGWVMWGHAEAAVETCT
jgi:hypothetical protein